MRGILIILLALLFCNPSIAQTPTITTKSPLQTSFCAGGNILVEFETTGTFDFGNFFTAQLSDMWGSFDNPVNIGTVPVNLGVIPGTIPSNTTFGFNYRVRVVSSNPSVIGSASPLPPIIITNSAISSTIYATPDDSVCTGDTVELHVTPNESYFWSTGDTTSTITVTESGTYRVTVTNYFTGCEVTSPDFNVVVHPLPPVALGNDTSICDGDVLVLDAGSNYVYYKWNNGVSSSQDFYVHDSGTYFVEVKDSNDCKNYDTISVVVNLNPVINLGNDTAFCGNVFFLDPGSGFISYNWNDGLSYNQVLQIHNAGQYYVVVRDTNLCFAYDTIDLNIMHIPFLSLGNDMTICGSSIFLDAGSGFTAYNWNDGSGYNQYYLVTQSGSVHVMITDSNNCMVTDTVNVTFLPVPIVNIGPDIVCGNDQLITLDAGTGFVTYLWSDGSTGQTMDVNTTILDEGTHVFWVGVFDQNGCYNSDSVNISVDFSFSINENKQGAHVSVFPNPFTDKVLLKIPSGLSSNTEIFVYDLLGKRATVSYQIQDNQICLDGRSLKKGMYVFSIITDDHTVIKGTFIRE